MIIGMSDGLVLLYFSFLYLLFVKTWSFVYNSLENDLIIQPYITTTARRGPICLQPRTEPQSLVDVSLLNIREIEMLFFFFSQHGPNSIDDTALGPP